MTGKTSKLCIITEVSADFVDQLPHPDQGLPGEQPGGGGEGSPPRPSHPIYYPDARPDQGLPGEQPYPDQGLPGEQPRPDQGLPGEQPEIDNTLPGEQPRPDQGLPPFPSHPIVLPPEGGEGGGETPPEIVEILQNWDMRCGWTAETGWVVVLAPTGDQNIPTPSRKRR